MTHAGMDAAVAPPETSRGRSLRRAARVALALAAVAALCRVAIGLLPSERSGGSPVQLLGLYGAIALAAVALRWGIGQRAAIARWFALGAGALMAAVLVAGRAEFGLFWHHLPLPPLDAILFPARLLIVAGFVVAGLCCAVAPADGFRWR